MAAESAGTSLFQVVCDIDHLLSKNTMIVHRSASTVN